MGLCTGSSSLAFLESSSFVPATVQSASHDQLTQQITVIYTRHTALTTTSTLTLPLATALTVKSAEAGRVTGTWGGGMESYVFPAPGQPDTVATSMNWTAYLLPLSSRVGFRKTPREGEKPWVDWTLLSWCVWVEDLGLGQEATDLACGRMNWERELLVP